MEEISSIPEEGFHFISASNSPLPIAPAVSVREADSNHITYRISKNFLFASTS